MRFSKSQLNTLSTPNILSGRYENDATEFLLPQGGQESVTLTHRGSPNIPNPFTMWIGRHGDMEQIEGQTLSLIIPPSNLSHSTTQVVDTQFIRSGYMPILGGTTQLTLSASGSSPAFITDASGLCHTVGPSSYPQENLTRTYSLGYQHFRSLVAMFKSNGYQRLESTASSGSGDMRVPHVLDAVVINYDDTTYFGHFSSFTIEVSASNPFRFDYSFEYVASGIRGDYVQGHICDGLNQNSGIIFGKQGTSLVQYSDLIDADALANNAARDPEQESTDEEEGKVAPPPGDLRSQIVSMINKLSRASNPDFISTYMLFMEDMFEQGYLVVPLSGFRSKEDQERVNKKYGFNTPYGKSLHNWGAALDINLVELKSNKWITSESSLDEWRATGVVETAKSWDIGWGGPYSPKNDPVHFPLRLGKSSEKGTLAVLKSRYPLEGNNSSSTKENGTTRE
jgi:hypothetical protein